jgi:hypothetical protein
MYIVVMRRSGLYANLKVSLVNMGSQFHIQMVSFGELFVLNAVSVFNSY